MPVIQCPVCENSFLVSHSKIRHGRGVFCSRACFSKSRRKTVTSVCRMCGRELEKSRANSLYCSRSCAVRTLYTKGKKQRRCVYCEGYFTTLSHNDRYCSRICEAKHNIANGSVHLMHDPWRNGDIAPVQYDKDYWSTPDASLGF